MSELTVHEVCVKHGINLDITREKVCRLKLEVLCRRKCSISQRRSNVYNEQDVLNAFHNRVVRGPYNRLEIWDADERPLEIVKHNFRGEKQEREAIGIIKGLSCYTR